MNHAAPANAGFEVLSPTLPGQGQRALNLRDVWAAVYRSRFWVAGIVAAALAVALAYALLTTRLYTSEVSIEVRQEAEKVLGTEADREGASSKLDADRFLQTQLEILRSRGIANSVAENLGLYRGDGFFDAMKVEPANSGSANQSLQDLRREQVQQMLIGNLDVEYSGNTRIAMVKFESPNPRLSAQIVNAYSDAFVRNNLARKFDSSSYALNFLRNQLDDAQLRLQASERAVLDYARRTRIVDPSNAAGNPGTGASLLAAQLVALNEAYAAAVASRIQTGGRWARIQQTPDLKVPEVMGNGAVQTALGTRASAESNYRKQQATRGASFPDVMQAQAQASEADRQVVLLARNARDTVRSEYDVALARERDLGRKLEQLKSKTLGEQGQGIRLSILRRDADTNRQQYDALLRRFAALNAEAGVQTNNLSIIDRGRVNEAPSWPKLPLILALGILAGMVLSALFIIVREQLFDAIRLPDDVSERLNLTLLGSVPRTNDLTADIGNPKSGASEAYNSIRTGLALAEGGIPKTLVFTSVQASEGKSSACHALALSLARTGRRVLILDADLRRPNAHRLFGLPNKAGIVTVLANGSPPEDAIQKTTNPMIDLFAAGDIPPNPSELIISPQFSALIDGLSKKYDVVLIDSAPILGLADAIILGNQAQATIFVIEAGRNTVRGAARALDRMERGGAQVAGAILTKYDPGQLGYGNADDYEYNYRYGS